MSKKSKERREARQQAQKRKNITMGVGLLAIVIGFGALAFAIVLIRGVYSSMETDDLDEMRITDQ